MCRKLFLYKGYEIIDALLWYYKDRLSSQVQQNQQKNYKALRGEYESQGVYEDDC